MSRLSRANLKARESVFAGGPEQYRDDIHATCSPNLAECVLAMEDCCEEAHAAQELVRGGTRDLPRMMRVLQSERLFLLIDEGTVRRYKARLTDEVEPCVNALLARAEGGLRELRRREAALRAKVEASKGRAPRPAGGAATHRLESRRLQMLVKQRERMEEEAAALEAEVEALELQLVS